MRVAVVGGGINGVMTAWELANRGCKVVLYERDTVMSATSSASTKLLHGGLRYLEHGSFGLVRESLSERQWWLQQAPDFTHPLRFVVPVYPRLSRPAMFLKAGLWMYDMLAGPHVLEPHGKLSALQVLEQVPGLREEGLRSGYGYTDVQMDDMALGRWAAEKARMAGVDIRERCLVDRVDPDGGIRTASGEEHYDRIVNTTGPWVGSLLDKSGVDRAYQLRLVRGSHLIVDWRLTHAVLMQVPEDRRVVFALPWKGNVLLGTTEVEQQDADNTECSSTEMEYLLSVWARYFREPVGAKEIIGSFAGVRPLIAEKRRVSSNTREFALERRGRLITVFGGKWTTARVLGQRAASAALTD